MKRVIRCGAVILVLAAAIGLIWHFLSGPGATPAEKYMKEHPYEFDTRRDLGSEQKETYSAENNCAFLAYPKTEAEETNRVIGAFVEEAKEALAGFSSEEGEFTRLALDYQAEQQEGRYSLKLFYSIGRYTPEGEGEDTLRAEKQLYLSDKAEMLGLNDLLGEETETKVNLLLKSSGKTTEGLSYFSLNGDTLELHWADRVESLSVNAIAHAGTIDPDKPMIALTFDDGPGQYSRKFADLLEQYNAHGTFFVLGVNVSSYADSLKYVYEKGNEIGSHTYSHKNLLKLSESAIRSEIQQARDAIRKAIGADPTVLRTPYGNSNATVLKIADEPIIGWNVDTEDWRSRNAQSVKAEILKGAGDGNIILMHEIYESTYDGLAMALKELTDQGYQLVTVSELMQYRGIDPENKVYRCFPPSDKE